MLRVLALINSEVELLGDARKVVLGGSSQGCSIALETYLQYAKGVLGGCFALRGVHLAVTDWSQIDLDLKKQTPVMLYHGDIDDTIEITFAKRNYHNLLKTKNLDHYEFIEEKGLDHFETSKKENTEVEKFLFNTLK